MHHGLAHLPVAAQVSTIKPHTGITEAAGSFELPRNSMREEVDAEFNEKLEEGSKTAEKLIGCILGHPGIGM